MKKKILSLILALTMLLPAFSATVFAENEDNSEVSVQAEVSDDVFIAETGEFGEGFTWTYENGTLTISGEGAMPDFSGTNDMPYKDCRYYNAKLVIDDGITHIGDYAFANFYYITDVTFGKDVRTIGSQAFYGCTSLSNISFNDGLEEIGYNAFRECSALTEITLPEKLKIIEGWAFSLCWKLETVNVSNNLTTIDNNVFSSTAIVEKEENWEDGLFYIGDYVFEVDQSISYDYVTIREGTKVIPRLYYLDCKTIYIPESVMTEFDDGYFNNTIIIEGEKDGNVKRLAEAEYIPFFEKGAEHIMSGSLQNEMRWTLDFDARTLTVSGEGAMPEVSVEGTPWRFYNRFIETFEVKDGITTIPDGTFPSVKKLIIPESVIQIDETDFYESTMVCGKVGSYAEQYAIENGLLFCDENGNVIARGECGEDAQWTYIQSDYKLIISGTGAMWDYDNVYDTPWSDFDIEEIEIKNGITSIGANIFRSDSYGYDWLVVPDSVINIDNSAITGYVNYTVIYCSEESYAHSWAEEKQRTHESYGAYQEIEVKNETELLAAIGSNRKIILADGLYTFDETVKLDHRRNLEITAKEVGSAEILTRDGYKPSILFNHCASASVNKVILGHTSVSYQGNGCGTGTTSSGYVLSAQYSKDINATECDLYGCGTIAVWLYDTLSFNADKCILRDCREKAVYSYIYDRKAKAEFSDCIISGNAYDEQFARVEPNVDADGANVEFNNCLFLNNYNTRLTNYEELVEFNDCRFEDNAWQEDGKPKDSGICLNGITWQIVDEQTEWGYTYKALKIGYPLEYEDGNIESEKGILINYSQYSKPWKRNYYIEQMYFADGIILGGSCGENVKWELENGVLTISGSGDMNDFESYAPWNDYAGMIDSIVIEDGVTSIGQKAFTNCWMVESLEIPKSVVKIGDYALPEENIKEFIVAEDNASFASLDGVLFNKDMTTLVAYPKRKEGEKYTIPSTVKTIGNNSFSYTYLTDIVIPDSVTEIEGAAFFSAKIKTVEIPKNVEKIGTNAFYSKNLLGFTVADGNVNFSAVDGVLFNKDKTVLVLCPMGKDVMEYTVPDGVLEIGRRAFNDTLIKSIRLSETVTTIGSEALMSNAIAKVYIPESVTNIDNSAMYYNANTTIICKENSYAQTYAEEHYIDYVFEDNVPIASAKVVSSEELGESWVEVSALLPENRTVDGYVVAAIYNFDGTLMAVKKVKVTGDTVEFRVDTERFPMERLIKILWWDFDGGNAPLSKVYENRLG